MGMVTLHLVIGVGVFILPLFLLVFGLSDMGETGLNLATLYIIIGGISFVSSVITAIVLLTKFANQPAAHGFLSYSDTIASVLMSLGLLIDGVIAYVPKSATPCYQYKLVYGLFIVAIVTGFLSVLGMAIERFQAFALYRDHRRMTRKFNVTWFLMSWTLAICFATMLLAQIKEVDNKGKILPDSNFRHILVLDIFPGPHSDHSKINMPPYCIDAIDGDCIPSEDSTENHQIICDDDVQIDYQDDDYDDCIEEDTDNILVDVPDFTGENTDNKKNETVKPIENESEHKPSGWIDDLTSITVHNEEIVVNNEHVTETQNDETPLATELVGIKHLPKRGHSRESRQAENPTGKDDTVQNNMEKSLFAVTRDVQTFGSKRCKKHHVTKKDLDGAILDVGRRAKLSIGKDLRMDVAVFRSKPCIPANRQKDKQVKNSVGNDDKSLDTVPLPENPGPGTCTVTSKRFVKYYFILLFLLCFATPVLITTSLNVFITSAVKNTHHEIISHHQWLTLAACVIMWGPSLTERLVNVISRSDSDSGELAATPPPAWHLPLSVFLFLLGHTHNLLRSVLHAVFATQIYNEARRGSFGHALARATENKNKVRPVEACKVTIMDVKETPKTMEPRDAIVTTPRRGTVPNIQIIETTCT